MSRRPRDKAAIAYSVTQLLPSLPKTAERALLEYLIWWAGRRRPRKEFEAEARRYRGGTLNPDEFDRVWALMPDDLAGPPDPANPKRRRAGRPAKYPLGNRVLKSGY